MIWLVKSVHNTHLKPEASSFYHLARRLSEPRVVVFSQEVEAIRNPGRDFFASTYIHHLELQLKRKITK